MARGRSTGRPVRAIASHREPRTTVGGVNLVSGFRPELWREVAAGAAPAASIRTWMVELRDATQHDAVLRISGGSYDIAFDVAHQIIRVLDGLASVAEQTTS